jgi:hypothetical protein
MDLAVGVWPRTCSVVCPVHVSKSTFRGLNVAEVCKLISIWGTMCFAGCTDSERKIASAVARHRCTTAYS